MDYLKYLAEEIHTVIMATTDEEGLPVTCAVDIMDYDDDGLYFLTAKGKELYSRLTHSKYVALTGIKGSDTLSCTAVSVRGKVMDIGGGLLDRLFEKNSYMEQIYPTEKSRKALTVFRIYEGCGQWFDLSCKPIRRASFTIGEGAAPKYGYEIGPCCTGCGQCRAVCPQDCIDFSSVPAIINQTNCLHCGNCMSICSKNAVTKRG